MASIVKEISVSKLIIETEDGYMETSIDTEEVEQFIKAHEWHKSTVRLTPGRVPISRDRNRA
jgi:hypothetical protein